MQRTYKGREERVPLQKSIDNILAAAPVRRYANKRGALVIE